MEERSTSFSVMDSVKVGTEVQMLQTVTGPIILYSKPDMTSSSSHLVSESQLGHTVSPVEQAQTFSADSTLKHTLLPLSDSHAESELQQPQAVEEPSHSSGGQGEDLLQCGKCCHVSHGVIDFLFHKATHVGPGLGLGCEICGTSYTRQVALSEHYKRKHKIILQQKIETKHKHSSKIQKTKATRNIKTMEVQDEKSTCKNEQAERDAIHVNQIHMELIPLSAANTQHNPVISEGENKNFPGFVELNEQSEPIAVNANTAKKDNCIGITDTSTGNSTEKVTEENENKNPSSGFSMQDFHFILKLNHIKGNSFNYGKHLFRCLYCEHKTYWRNALCRHMREKHSDILNIHRYLEIKDHPVELGQKVMKMSQYLLLQKDRSKAKRIRGVEKQDIPGSFPCSKCGKVFSRLRYLRKHSKIHSTDKELLCSVCGKAFKSRAYLSQHLKTHKEKEAYNCPQCDFVSCVNSAIHAHRQLHTDGSVLCDICGYAYTDRSTLNKHKAVHDLSRPFACTYPGCTWRFKTEVMCRSHFRAHTTEGKFVCSRCGYAFRHKHHLQRHEKQMHGVVSVKSVYRPPLVETEEEEVETVNQTPDQQKEAPVNLIVSEENGIILNSVDGEEEFELETALQNNQLVIATDEDGNTINYEMTDIAMNVAYQALLQGQEGHHVDSHTILIPQTDGSHIVFQHEEVTETVHSEAIGMETTNTEIVCAEEEC